MTETRTNRLPVCFTRKEMIEALHKSKSALDSWIKRALKNGKIMPLRGGLYIRSETYLHKPDKATLHEFLATQIRKPSYISLEYALMKHGMLLSDANQIQPTLITNKPSRKFTNFIGEFLYSNIKPSLYYGFEERNFQNIKYHMATKSKALFDFLYLHRDLHRRSKKLLRKRLFEELGLQWSEFSESDFEEFGRYVWKSNSTKMIHIWEVLRERFDNIRMDKEFAQFRKELLGESG